LLKMPVVRASVELWHGKLGKAQETFSGLRFVESGWFARRAALIVAWQTRAYTALDRNDIGEINDASILAGVPGRVTDFGVAC
jgi:hypothetical protein